MTNGSFSVIHGQFQKTIWQCCQTNDIVELKNEFNKAIGNVNDKKGILDQAFRDVLLEHAIENNSKIEVLINLSVNACREDISTSTIPVVLLGDVFDAVTLEQCESLFTFVEKNVGVWKESLFFASCKNNLLRICNDLLKRFSRAQNTVFCGRILLFLATFFPFSERSGLNIISEFNLENLTEFENDATDIGESIDSEIVTVKIDHNLYCKFWSLQDFFRNPNKCYDLNEWKDFSTQITSVLSAFQSFKLEEQQGSSISAVAQPNGNDAADAMMVDDDSDAQHFFAKFLTNPKLLALQLSDANFRRSVLVQCLILFQYLTSTVKFKTDAHNLNPSQLDFLRETESTVYSLLEETPPNGKKFAKSVRHMLKREDLWNNWKNDGCKEFKRPATEDAQGSPKKKQKAHLGDLIRDATKNNKFYLGNSELTRLWNLCPDNLEACRGDDRNFLPTIESYLENPKDKSDPSYEWRALRLLARQSPLFFTHLAAPTKIPDYLKKIREKIHETTTKNVKTEQENSKPENDGDLVVEKEDVEDDSDLMRADQLTQDDRNVHKTVTATEEQMKALCVIINDDWKKLADKLGFKQDEIRHFAESKPTSSEQCGIMLQIWQEEEDDASLDNLAYIMEGLGMIGAADYIKRILEPADKMEDISE